MKRQLLVEVPDPGAAEMIVAALTDEGIAADVRRASRNPYQVTAFAEPLRITVAPGDLPRARAALERLAMEMVPEVNAQADAGNEEPIEPVRRPSALIAAALGLLVPVPVACLYVGWRRRGGICAVAFVTALIVAVTRGAPSTAVFVMVAAKLVDLGAALVALARRAR